MRIIFLENTTTELKLKYTPTIIKTVIAFANTNGGIIYIGVSDSGQVEGVDELDSTMLSVSNAVRDSIKPDITLFVEYVSEVIENKTVIKVIVQKGTSSPYYFAKKGIRPEGVFVRQGSSTVPATETAILHMIKETDGEKYEDMRSLNQALTFVVANQKFREQNISFDITKKKTLGLIDENSIFTNLGLLLSDQCLHTIKVAIFEGTDKSQFRERRKFTGSLLKQLDEVYEFIGRYNGINTEFIGLQRVDRRDYPMEAIREALLNAIAHRDYSFIDSTLISIFTNRIEIVSIGGLVRGMSFADMMLGASIIRNQKLANIFYQLLLIEAYGTGVPRIVQSYKEYNFVPRIETTDNAFKITLPNINETSTTDTQFILPSIDETSTENSLTTNEQKVLELFSSNIFISRSDIEKQLDIKQATAVRILKSLQNKGLIQVSGDGKNTKYYLK